MRAALVLSALLAAGFAHAEDLSECAAQERNVTVQMYPNEGAMLKVYRRLTGVRLRSLHGFATHNRRTDVHTLHVVLVLGISSHEQLKTLGHELLHALCGEWHDPRDHG